MITHLFLDFDGVLTDNFVYVNSHGDEMVRCSRADGIGIKKLKDKEVSVIIISTEEDFVVAHRAKKLGLHLFQGVKNKKSQIEAFGLDLSKAAFMGNDINDLEAMEAVGIAIAPADARPEIRAIAKYVTKARGGNGAVREACGWLMSKYFT